MKTEEYPPEKRPHRGVFWQHVPKSMQSGPIAAFSAKAEKNACLRQASIRRARSTFREVPYAEQGAPFGGLPYGEQDPLSQQAPYAKQKGVNRLNIV